MLYLKAGEIDVPPTTIGEELPSRTGGLKRWFLFCRRYHVAVCARADHNVKRNAIVQNLTPPLLMVSLMPFS
jgi:hypothetical protein